MFTVAQAATLADMKPATVRLWLRDGLIGTTHDQIAEASGATSFLSVDTVMALAMAAWLRQLGAHPTIACKAGTRLAAMPVPTRTKADSAYANIDGDVGFIPKDRAFKAAEIRDGGWILPYSRIFDAVWAAALAMKRGGAA